MTTSKHSYVTDAAVTDISKWKLNVLQHASSLWDTTNVLLQDVLEGLIFVTFAFALDGRQVGTREWLQKCLVVAVGFWAVDMFAPALANAIRLGVPILFYAQPH
jgi:hypothetical protein